MIVNSTLGDLELNTVNWQSKGFVKQCSLNQLPCSDLIMSVISRHSEAPGRFCLL